MQDFFYTIEDSSVAEFKDKGSKFLAYAYPFTNKENLKKHIQVLKSQHPKAIHFCYAYRIGLDGNEFRVSDDGEPSGSAGKPILNQIDSKQLTDVLVVVVRYFGGTLLGIPGLINAYKTATGLVLQLIPILEKPIEILYKLEFDYTRMNEIMFLIKQYNCTILKQKAQLFCTMEIGIPKVRAEEVLHKLNDLHYVQATNMN